MSKVSKKKLLSPTVQHPAARWAFVLVLCAALGIVASYYWRVFYGLDARGLAPLAVTGFCVGLSILAGAAALPVRGGAAAAPGQGLCQTGHGVHPFVRYVVRFCKSADADPR